jgi:hypothetical protein
MITLGVVGIKSDNQISQTFTIGELSEHQSKQLIPTSEMLYVTITLVLIDYAAKFIFVQK